MTKYSDYVATKLAREVPTGIADAIVDSPHLFEFQRDLVQWALRRGRAAIFADTGLGKSRMQLTWAARVAEYTGKPVLILAPLAVGQQTRAEASAVGIRSTVVKSGDEVTDSGVFVTNYERLHLFDASIFGGVVLDESSIIKSYNSKTLQCVMDAFARTPFKLCCTATPSPNDYTELGNHAEFLGVCSRVEMLSEYFMHDGGETQSWRLKGHARGLFWKFVATWAALVRSPADLGYDGSAYVLPALNIEHHTIAATAESVSASGLLFAMPATGLMERRQARAGSINDRVQQCADMVNASDDHWIVWCDLNAESTALAKSINGAVEVTGAMTTEQKEDALVRFSNGEHRVLVSKSSICGFGMNWQHVSRMAFVGVTDSWESYYQAVRRIYRFGQKSECTVHIFASELEGAVVANLKRKERDAMAMSEDLSRESCDAVRSQIRGMKRDTNSYDASKRMRLPAWIVSEEGGTQ